jgi:hypothetical protein
VYVFSPAETVNDGKTRSRCTLGKKTAFLSHFYIKCIILPRQARDKHRETTQKKCHFPSGGVGVLAVLVVLLLVWFWNSRWVMVTKKVVGLFFGSTVCA